jgi:hypothetical protein
LDYSETQSRIIGGIYNLKSRNSYGCETPDCCRNFVPPGYPPTPTVIITQPDCLPNGTIVVSDSASLYSYDNGNTWVTATNEWFECYDVAY